MGTGNLRRLPARPGPRPERGLRAAAASYLRRAALAAVLGVLLSPALPAAGSPQAWVRGEVVSWKTGRPVAGATIYLPGYGTWTTSGRGGTFAFPGALPTDHPYRRITAMVTAPRFGRWTIERVPLWDGDTLELHAELRSSPWSHTVLTREERAALAPPPDTSPDGYTSTCTGWKYNLAPPQTIKVWITDDQVSKKYDMDFYATHVLPNEWIASWDADALGAGAIPVKEYAWYRASPGHAYSGGSGCADIQDTTADQVFDPSWSNANTDQAVYATFGSILWKGGDIFLSQYYAGAKGDPCAPVTGQYAGRMSQWGTETCAEDSMLWPDIVITFYPDDTEWQDLDNLVLNPRFESRAMYPWTTKYASITRTQGGAYEGLYYGTLTPTVNGKSASLRNEQPFDATTNTTYHEQVKLMCPVATEANCSVTIKVLAIPDTGSYVEQNKTVSVPDDGAWHSYTFDTTAMGIVHSSVRFSVTSGKTVGVDAALLNSEFGGP